jgi:hypothetical protein
MEGKRRSSAITWGSTPTPVHCVKMNREMADQTGFKKDVPSKNCSREL